MTLQSGRPDFRAMSVAVALVALVLTAPRRAPASPKEIAPGVLVEDFEDASLAGWDTQGERVEIEKENGNAVLELGGANVWLKDKALEHFAIEGKIRREYQAIGGKVGFILRDDYTVDIRMIGRFELHGPNKAKSRGMTRGVQTDRYRTMKVVCAGPIIRFYLDGEYEGQFNGADVRPGRVALYGGDDAHSVYFDDVRIDTNLDPGLFLTVEPQAEELVFSPKKDVRITFKVTNHFSSEQKAEFGVSVRSWEGEGVLREKKQSVSMTAGEEKTVTVNLGKVPPGFHKMLVTPMNRVLPLAIQERGTGEYAPPDIVIGGYWYYKHWDFPPVWWKTYVHGMARKIRENGFNTVVNFGGMPAATMDILQTYGISCFSRGGNMGHPAVLGAFISDEPTEEDIPRLKEQYRKIHEKYPDKRLTTCMIGGGGLKGHVLNAWEELAEFNQIRMFRWYGIKKSWAGINRQRRGMVPFTELLRQARGPEGDYWVIMPSFGGDDETAFYGNPLPAEIKAMMHLCAANGAKGLIFYTFHGDDCFLKAATLVPADGKWAAAGEVARKITKNAALLKSLEHGGSMQFIDDYLVEGYTLTGDDANYYYVVNRDVRKERSFRMFKLDPNGSLYDLYAEKKVPIRRETVELLRPGVEIDTGVVHLTLGPGDGTLFRYEPGGKEKQFAAPRVKYPAWVEKVAPEKTRYLIDLEAENTPKPGWVPLNNYKKHPWVSLNKDTTLYAGLNDTGQEYRKSLYAQAETTIIYSIPAEFTHFVAAAGFGNKAQNASVVFRVLVDGQEKYNSGLYRLSDVLPVVVDIRGGKELRLITEEAGDGIYNDHAFWGEARLVRK